MDPQQRERAGTPARLVELPGARARPRSGAPVAEGGRQSGPWLVSALALALAIAVVALGLQTRRAGQLEGQVQSLGAELTGARQALRAYERRLGEVRGHVDDLAGRIGALQALVSEEAPAPEGPSADPAKGSVPDQP